MARTKNFADVIRSKLAANPDLAALVEEEAFYAQIAEAIYEARKAASLTQTQLASRINTQQSVIARMEDADYHGHSLTQLRKIAAALDMNLCIEFFPKSLLAPCTTEIATAAGVIELSGEAYVETEWSPELTVKFEEVST